MATKKTKSTKSIKSAPVLRDATPYKNSAGVKLPNADLIIEADASGAVTSCRDVVTGTEYIGGGGGVGELVYEAEFDVNTTSETPITAFINNSVSFKKEVYYLWFIKDTNPVVGSTRKLIVSCGCCLIGTTDSSAGPALPIQTVLQTSSNLTRYQTADSNYFGIYVSSFTTASIAVAAKYSSVFTGTINSRYKLEVYEILDVRNLIS